LATELAELGEWWERNEPERRQKIGRRAELYIELDSRPGVSHSDIARLARSTKGAVEQVLASQRRKQAATGA
jgi:hypothetical protein